MLLGRQQGAVLPSANLAVLERPSYLGVLTPAKMLRQWSREGVVLAVLLGRPFLDPGRQDCATRNMIPGRAYDDKSINSVV
jgi:hypothetical protein